MTVTKARIASPFQVDIMLGDVPAMKKSSAENVYNMPLLSGRRSSSVPTAWNTTLLQD